ncbi:TetR/AcrR family transcriptional regulator [Streptomyces sp. NBC_01334]|uniref:TetR/AcrR family transcriptional regulator n=1 Tax=Streptomyces sp. NBC_01334 TaxID=2903827 RepID=UPI002E158722|nr:TetR/AcrR family transcriptional regulator [Streptomyces sp. NBC_01334]
MPRPPGHGPGFEVRRQKIIDIAASLFAQQGYAATSINDLGRAVGLAKGALYYYIGSKENLLVEIQARVMGPLLSRARQIADLDTDPLLRLRLLSESLLTIIFRRLDHIWVYEHDYRSLSGAELKTLLGQRSDFEQVISGLLAEAVDQGTFRAMPPRLATLQFLNLHNHTYQWVRTDGQWDAAFLSREYCATLFRGFGAPDHALPKLEQQAEAFKHDHPELPLDPEAGWNSRPAIEQPTGPGSESA